jgi:hypothetical protein
MVRRFLFHYKLNASFPHMLYCTNLPKNVNANKRGIYFAFYDDDVLEKEVCMDEKLHLVEMA